MRRCDRHAAHYGHPDRSPTKLCEVECHHTELARERIFVAAGIIPSNAVMLLSRRARTRRNGICSCTSRAAVAEAAARRHVERSLSGCAATAAARPQSGSATSPLEANHKGYGLQPQSPSKERERDTFTEKTSAVCCSVCGARACICTRADHRRYHCTT